MPVRRLPGQGSVQHSEERHRYEAAITIDGRKRRRMFSYTSKRDAPHARRSAEAALQELRAELVALATRGDHATLAMRLRRLRLDRLRDRVAEEDVPGWLYGPTSTNRERVLEALGGGRALHDEPSTSRSASALVFPDRDWTKELR